MATGERTFSSRGREVKRMEFTPVPPGDYEGVLRLEGWKIAKAQGAGKLPRLSGPIELLNTASSDGGKNRRMFHDFYLDATPSEKDGVAMVDRSGGLVEFARAVNAEVEGVHMEKMKKIDDRTGQESMRDVLNPQETLRWLKQFEGTIFKLRVKIEKGTQGYSDRNRVSYFVESEAAEEVAETETDTDEMAEAEFESDATEDTELPAMDEDVEEAEFDEIEEETTPPPARRTVVQKPATRTAPTKNGVARKTAAITAAKKTTGRPQARR